MSLSESLLESDSERQGTLDQAQELEARKGREEMDKEETQRNYKAQKKYGLSHLPY